MSRYIHFPAEILEQAKTILGVMKSHPHIESEMISNTGFSLVISVTGDFSNAVELADGIRTKAFDPMVRRGNLSTANYITVPYNLPS